MDERGIAYHFWYRVSYVDGRLELLLRYDPNRYTLKTALQTVDKTKNMLIQALNLLD